MYFPLFEPYLSENSIVEDFTLLNTNNIEDDECIICLEKKDSMKVQKYCEVKNYNIKCECNYSIHPQCLIQWFRIKNNCPICKYVFPMTTQNEEFTNDEYSYPIIIFYFLTGNYQINHFMNRNIHFYIMYTCLKNLMILIIISFYFILLMVLLVYFII